MVFPDSVIFFHTPDTVTFPPTSVAIAACERAFSRNTTIMDPFLGDHLPLSLNVIVLFIF